jgi:hypothetical protein
MNSRTKILLHETSCPLSKEIEQSFEVFNEINAEL